MTYTWADLALGIGLGMLGAIALSLSGSGEHAILGIPVGIVSTVIGSELRDMVKPKGDD